MEEKTSRSTNFSQMLLHTRENMFLSDILLQGVKLETLRWSHPEILSNALQWSSENMEMAASLWAEFSNLFYTSRGRQVPELPLFVEIQEGLGVYGRGPIEKCLRKFNVLLDKLFGPSGPPGNR
jgi:hypothetical protein